MYLLDKARPYQDQPLGILQSSLVYIFLGLYEWWVVAEKDPLL